MATEKKKRIHVKAVRMKKKTLKKLNDQKHCCIPEYIKAPTEDVEYKCPFIDIKKARIAYLKTHYRAKKKRNAPWYMLTSGKCYNYEERQKSF